jgi:hypothetical protein
MKMAGPCQRLSAVIWLSLICLFFITLSLFYTTSKLGSLSKITPPLHWPIFHGEHVANSTLGFQKIFVVNLPARTDRRDILELMAVASGIEVDFTSAISGKDVPDVALFQVRAYFFLDLIYRNDKGK